MRQVFPFGKFYGATRRRLKTPAFAFAEVEDLLNSRVPTHTHENAHFCFIVSGEFEAKIKDRKRLCPASTMLYRRAGTTHDDHLYTTGGKFLTISLTSETNKKLLEEIKFFDYSTDFKDGEISRLGKRIARELQSPDSLSAIVLQSLAKELVVYSTRSFERYAKPPAWLKSACEIIKNRCQESISVAEIAKECGIHPLHLARAFRKFFGYSPGEYLRKYRIESASNLPVNSRKTLVEIALLSGFADQSRFTRSFKQHTRITPAKFREAHT